jgi:hypothetical protein
MGTQLEQNPLLKGSIPEGLIGGLIDALPTGCTAFSKMGDFDYNSIVTAIPDILDLLEQLNQLEFIKTYIPDISTSCKDTFTNSLVPRLKGSVTTALPNAICHTDRGVKLAEERCIKALVKDIASISFVTDLMKDKLGSAINLVGLVDDVFALLPEACPLVKSLLSKNGFSFTHVLEAVPGVLDLLTKMKSYPVIGQFLPAISGSCVDTFKGMAQTGLETKSLTELPDVICTMVNDRNVKSCIVNLGKELDGIDMLSHVIKTQLGSGVSIEALMQMATDILPDACKIMKAVYKNGAVDFDALYGKINDIISLIKTVREGLPAALQVYVPEWPEECSESQVDEIVNKIVAGVSKPETFPEILCGKDESKSV